MNDQDRSELRALRAIDAALPPTASDGDEALWRRAADEARRRDRTRTVRVYGALALAACALLTWRVVGSRSEFTPAATRTAQRSSTAPTVAPNTPSRVDQQSPPTRATDDRVPFEASARVELGVGEMTASADARGTIRRDREGITHVELGAGEVTVIAAPTAARRLVVERGSWSAWVHGTRFSVRAVGAGIEVRVREGDVLVRGPEDLEGLHALAGSIARVREGRWSVSTEPSVQVVSEGVVVRREAPDSAVDEGLVRRASLALAAHDGRRALAGFSGYLARHPRGALAEDALAGVMDARAQLGDDAGAAQAARVYLRRFATGVARERAARILGESP